LTHIWHGNNECKEWHINIKDDLETLKSLLVTYCSGHVPVKEIKGDGGWVLVAGDNNGDDRIVIAREVRNSDRGLPTKK